MRSRASRSGARDSWVPGASSAVRTIRRTRAGWSTMLSRIRYAALSRPSVCPNAAGNVQVRERLAPPASPGESHGEGDLAGDLVATSDPLADGDHQVQHSGAHARRVGLVPAEGGVGAGRLGHPVCGDRAGVDSAGPVAQEAALPSAEEAADDVLRHRRERAGGVQAEAAQGVGLGGADAVERTGRERAEECLDGPVVGEVKHFGPSRVGGCGRLA